MTNTGGMDANRERNLIATFRCPALDFDQRREALNDLLVTSRSVLAIVREGGTDSELAMALTDREEILDLCGYDAVPRSRGTVAFNPSCPASVLERLARDPDPRVRANAAMNGNLSPSMRVSLARHDPDDYVRGQAWWAMSSCEGRAVLDGARLAHLRHQPLPEDDQPFLVMNFGFGEHSSLSGPV